MHIVLVHVQVKSEFVEAFKNAILDNERGSILEHGVIRFDVLQQADDPTHFALYEVYRTPEDQMKHRETPHYLRWRDTVAEMMAEPRHAVRYLNLAPSDSNFATPQ
jgi:(4S)-4-hydroxy-5-phosphonooxypentane-2,3-dione isomerase